MSTNMMLATVDILAIVLFGIAKMKIKPKIFRGMSILTLVLYAGAFLYFMVFSRTSVIEPKWNIIPFRPYEVADAFSYEFIFHGLFYVPIGLLLCGIFPYGKPIHTILMGMGISVAIEFLQLFIHIGVCDINDLIASGIGCVLGVWIAGRFRRCPKR